MHNKKKNLFLQINSSYVCVCVTLCENPAKGIFFRLNIFCIWSLHIVKNILWKYILGIFNID